MPTVTLALPYISMQARLVRTGLLEALGQDYTQTALAKGAGYVYVVLRHSLRNALLPVVTVIGLQFGHLLGGAIVVETVFAWPGIGRLLVDSILNRDYSVVQAAVAFMTAAFLVVNFVVDVVYRMIDPRVELAEGSKT